MDSETLGDFSVDSAQLLAKMKNHLISNGFEPGTLRDYDSNLAVAKKLQMTVPTAESLHSDDDPISSFGTQSPATDRQHDISKANVSCDDSGVDVHCASNAPQTTRPCDCGDARDHGSQVCCDLCQSKRPANGVVYSLLSIRFRLVSHVCWYSPMSSLTIDTR